MSATAEQMTLPMATGRHPELHQYWRSQLKDWIHDVRYYRHARNTTGWSWATGGYDFARWLFRDGAMSRAELRRYFRLHRRVMRWDRMEGAA